MGQILDANMEGFCRDSQHHKHLYRGGRWGVWGATKWQFTAEISNFLFEMAHKEIPMYLKYHKT